MSKQRDNILEIVGGRLDGLRINMGPAPVPPGCPKCGHWMSPKLRVTKDRNGDLVPVDGWACPFCVDEDSMGRHATGKGPR